MKKYVVLDKKVGETPLQALTAWKHRNREYDDVPASYAGRLDPMASGKLIILLGDECKRQKKYTKLDKEYEIEVLLDVGSDTGDALGLVEYPHKQTNPVEKAVRDVLAREVGTHVRPYPHFSSKTVDGKPLFLHALEGGLASVHLPEHEESIYRLRLLATRHTSSGSLRSRVIEFLKRVPRSSEPSKRLGADFRIHAVEEHWDKAFKEAKQRSFTVLTLRVACGSGTYMRSLAPRIGEALGTKALALSIRRTRIGTHWWRWWLSEY